MRTWVVVMVFPLFVWAGCSSDSGPTEGEKACQDFEAKLNKCGYTSNGTCNTNNPCGVRCALNADCSQITMSPPTGDYLACVAACAGAGPNDFICADAKRAIPKAMVCDGKFQCEDGSDEANCGGKDAGKD